MIELLKKNNELWDLFTRTEEYNPEILDKHKRFRYHYSKYQHIFEPKVSEFLVKNGFKFQWPDNHKFAVCLTHDIDNIYPSWKYRYFTSLKFATKFQWQKSLDRGSKKENPYWNFRRIISLEKKYDAKSSFYIMLDKSNYDAVELKDELINIIDNSHEVGLHGGHQTYNDFNLMIREKVKLEEIVGKKIIGYRNHYLKFKIPDTWTLLYKAGFKYDTTLGYADSVGFRNGMCHPFKPFDLNSGKQSDILEIPLTIMDSTLLQYMHLNVEESWQICKKLIDTVRDLGGVVTILWHNSFFDEIYRRGWEKLYEKILKYCYGKNAWMTTGENIWKLIN